jgi:glycosyltransferase involved in cell wall biosynthesis
MTIGIDMRMAGTRHGGIGRYAFEITKHILEQDTANNYVLFFSRKLSSEEDIDFFTRFSNAKILTSSARHYSLAEQTSFLRLLNKQNLDLVHFPNFNAPIMYRRPFVVTIHDMVHHKLGGAKTSHALHFWAYQKVMAAAAKNSRRIITVSQVSKDDIHKILNITPAKIEVVYEGPTLAPGLDAAYVERVKKQYFLRKPYFLFVGVLERKKNVVNLTRGFDVFLKKYHLDMDLVIAGKADSHAPEIKHHALDITNHDRLVFTGYVEDKELRALYSGAYAYANASVNEGFGLPGVEAMQFGLPLLVANTPVFNELYDDAAVYFNPLDVNDIAEKMHLLARDRQFYDQIQRHSLQRGKLFSWKESAKKTLEIYNNSLI